MILLRLLLLFTIVPFIELALLLAVGERIGAAWTIAIVLVTGFLGAALARAQGLAVWHKLQSDLRGARAPAEALLDGVMILVAGALLITPGLLTDAAGFCLLIPQFRRMIRRALWNRWKRRFQVSVATSSPQSPPEPDIIDVEYTRKP